MSVDVDEKPVALPPVQMTQSGAENTAPQVTNVHRQLDRLSVRKNRFIYADKTLYRVYDKPDHFELVEAESAAEAFEKSGVKAPHKIQRELFFHYVALNPDQVEKSDDVIEVDVELPDSSEKQALFDAAMLASDPHEETGPQFEALDYAALGHQPAVVAAVEEAVAMQPEAPQEVAEAAPVVEDAVPEEEPAKELSKDEINALLDAQAED